MFASNEKLLTKTPGLYWSGSRTRTYSNSIYGIEMTSWPSYLSTIEKN